MSKVSFVFRWLHLSDLHFAVAAEDDAFRQAFLYGSYGPARQNEATNIDEGGLAWQISQEPVNCIVLTGDVFHKGHWTDDDRNKIERFLSELYSVCSEASTNEDKWNWVAGGEMDRLYFCPGNHDLKRDASLSNDGIVVSRRDVLSNIADISLATGRLETEMYGPLLLENTFSAFFKSLEKIAKSKPIPAESYDAYAFTPKFVKEGYNPFLFLAFNTATLAGQTYNKDSLEKALAISYQSFQEAHNIHNTLEALKEYTKYHELVLKLQGELVNDEKRLSFISENTERSIQDRLNTLPSKPIIVMFGHHPIQFLSDTAISRFKTFARSNASYIYLCGHTHIPRGEIIKPIDNLFPSGPAIYQICTGGLFIDKSEYNQCSFSIGSIIQESDKETATFKAEIYRLSRDVFDYWHWLPYVEEYPNFPHPAIGNGSQPTPKNPRNGRPSVKNEKIDSSGTDIFNCVSDSNFTNVNPIINANKNGLSMEKNEVDIPSPVTAKKAVEEIAKKNKKFIFGEDVNDEQENRN